MDAVTVVFLSTFINRVTEVFKKSVLDNIERLNDDQKGAITLFVSLLFGVLGVVVFFPTTNLFAGLGRSEVAELIATGIVIGGIANGFDFLATRIARPEVTARTSTLEVVATETEAVKPAA